MISELTPQERAEIDSYVAQVMPLAAKAWMDGKAPKFMYEPPFFVGWKCDNRNTGEEVLIQRHSPSGNPK